MRKGSVPTATTVPATNKFLGEAFTKTDFSTANSHGLSSISKKSQPRSTSPKISQLAQYFSSRASASVADPTKAANSNAYSTDVTNQNTTRNSRAAYNKRVGATNISAISSVASAKQTVASGANDSTIGSRNAFVSTNTNPGNRNHTKATGNLELQQQPPQLSPASPKKLPAAVNSAALTAAKRRFNMHNRPQVPNSSPISPAPDVSQNNNQATHTPVPVTPPVSVTNTNSDASSFAWPGTQDRKGRTVPQSPSTPGTNTNISTLHNEQQFRNGGGSSSQSSRRPQLVPPSARTTDAPPNPTRTLSNPDLGQQLATWIQNDDNNDADDQDFQMMVDDHTVSDVYRSFGMGSESSPNYSQYSKGGSSRSRYTTDSSISHSTKHLMPLPLPLPRALRKS